MTYALIKSDVDVSILTVVPDTDLSMEASFEALTQNETLVISKYEASTGADVFVKLDLTRDKPITLISYDKTTFMNYPLPLNALSLYKTYVYDSKYYGELNLNVDDLVKYRDDQGVIVASIVTGAFIDKDGLQYFQLDNASQLYMLSLVPEATTTSAYSNISGTTSVKAPVADGSADSHTVAVEDYQTKVWVLL